jgi:hypothetical protein
MTPSADFFENTLPAHLRESAAKRAGHAKAGRRARLSDYGLTEEKVHRAFSEYEAKYARFL